MTKNVYFWNETGVSPTICDFQILQQKREVPFAVLLWKTTGSVTVERELAGQVHLPAANFVDVFVILVPPEYVKFFNNLVVVDTR